jgi:P pilus assembly chaperone PapD
MAGRDRGHTTTGWLLRIGAVLAVLGVAGYDAGSIGITHLRLDDAAADAALDARQAVSETGDPRLAFRAAVTSAKAESSDITLSPASFRVAPDGAVTLRLTRTATTVLAHRVPWLQPATVVSAVGTAMPPMR